LSVFFRPLPPDSGVVISVVDDASLAGNWERVVRIQDLADLI